MEKYSHKEKKAIPTALLIFTHGFNASPTIVPNGGSEEIDELIIAWVRRNLVMQNQARAAA